MGSSEAEPAQTSGEWAFVRAWRAQPESVPWPQGLTLAGMITLISAVGTWVLGSGFVARPYLAIILLLVVTGGLAPALYLSRNMPVLRFIAGGVAAGLLLGWIAVLGLMLAT